MLTSEIKIPSIVASLRSVHLQKVYVKSSKTTQNFWQAISMISLQSQKPSVTVRRTTLFTTTNDLLTQRQLNQNPQATNTPTGKATMAADEDVSSFGSRSKGSKSSSGSGSSYYDVYSESSSKSGSRGSHSQTSQSDDYGQGSVIVTDDDATEEEEAETLTGSTSRRSADTLTGGSQSKRSSTLTGSSRVNRTSFHSQISGTSANMDPTIESITQKDDDNEDDAPSPAEYIEEEVIEEEEVLVEEDEEDTFEDETFDEEEVEEEVIVEGEEKEAEVKADTESVRSGSEQGDSVIKESFRANAGFGTKPSPSSSSSSSSNSSSSPSSRSQRQNRGKIESKGSNDQNSPSSFGSSKKEPASTSSRNKSSDGSRTGQKQQQGQQQTFGSQRLFNNDGSSRSKSSRSRKSQSEGSSSSRDTTSYSSSVNSTQRSRRSQQLDSPAEKQDPRIKMNGSHPSNAGSILNPSLVPRGMATAQNKTKSPFVLDTVSSNHGATSVPPTFNSPAGREGPKSIAVLGTMSDAGKSVIAAAICRILVNGGKRAAPFKAQNMSNNAAPALLPEGSRGEYLYRSFEHSVNGGNGSGGPAVHAASPIQEPGYGEIGTAQSLQAEACRLVPRVEMNPVLLKSGGKNSNGEYLCSVYVLGKQMIRETYGDLRKRTGSLQKMVLESHQALADVTKADVIVMEGAGSCTELNLMDRDIVNLPLVRALQVRMNESALPARLF